MDAAARARLEQELAGLCRAGDFGGAATAAIRGFGPELLGFLVALESDEGAAQEVFAQLCEDLWRGLPGFAGRSSLRTWLYTLARHASQRRRRGELRRDRRALPLDEVSSIADEVRTRTLPFLRTRVKDRLAQLRRALPVEDQELLILRVDRGLDWIDLARVLADDDAPLEGAALTRESARLRKRFQLVKQRLREQASREGLLEPDE